MIAISDYSYYEYFEKFSSWYYDEGLPVKSQVTHLIETYIVHVINGVNLIF